MQLLHQFEEAGQAALRNTGLRLVHALMRACVCVCAGACACVKFELLSPKSFFLILTLTPTLYTTYTCASRLQFALHC
jgi:hypothetical protein